MINKLRSYISIKLLNFNKQSIKNTTQNNQLQLKKRSIITKMSSIHNQKIFNELRADS